MAEEEIKTEEFPEDQERIITFKINVEGPSELVSWLRENRPDGRGMRERLSDLLPSEFRKHARAAQREQLLAIRSLLDVAIARMDERADRRSRKAVDVEID